MKTGVYLRVSTIDQDTGSQRREVAAYCRRSGWKTIIFEEKGSGEKESRPELVRLMEKVYAGEIDRVVVWKLDRLGRSLQHLVHIIGELARMRVPLICTSQGIDTSEENPAGRLQLNVLGAVAEFERELIRERTRAGLARAKSCGVRLGRPRIGKEVEARVKELRKSGKSFAKIAKELDISVGKAHAIGEGVKS